MRHYYQAAMTPAPQTPEPTDRANGRRGIVLVDHGSKRDAANRMLDDVVAMVQSHTADPVYAAHMELAEPTLAQAFDRAVADGAAEIIVFPYFLSPGRHSREDIPRMCAEAARRHPGLRWHCTGPVGLDPAMADLILARVETCRRNAFNCDDCPDHAICEQSDL